MTSRYEGQPFLRFLEFYVLRAIVELSAEQEKNVVALEPKLREIYGVDGPWYSIVASVMDFPKELDGELQRSWERSTVGGVIDPEEWARQTVDSNFV